MAVEEKLDEMEAITMNKSIIKNLLIETAELLDESAADADKRSIKCREINNGM